MKEFILVINMILLLASLVGIIWLLISGSYGMAWMHVIPLVYSWCNCEAIVAND